MFADALGLDAAIQESERERLALLLLMNSHRVFWGKRLVSDVEKMMKPYADDLLPKFIGAFRYTSSSVCKQFFAEPVV